MDEIESVLRLLLGSSTQGEDLTATQMAVRAAVVYVVTLLLVRLGKKRFLGKATAFDVILGIMLGSIVSRAVTGNAPFFPALLAAGVLIAMHWSFSALAFRSHRFGWVIKGRPRVLVRAGAIDWKAMRAAHLSEGDLQEEARRQHLSDLDQMAEVRLERSGDISIIRRKHEPKIVEVAVAEGVQTVRLELAG